MGATRCTLACFKVKNHTEVHQCAERCQTSLKTTGMAIEKEFTTFQNNVKACQEGLQAQLTPLAREAQSNPDLQIKLRKDAEAGISKCIQEAESMLPGIEKRVMKIIK